MLENKKFLAWLEEEEFELAFATHYHACPIGLVHLAQIPAWIWLQTLVYIMFMVFILSETKITIIAAISRIMSPKLLEFRYFPVMFLVSYRFSMYWWHNK